MSRHLVMPFSYGSGIKIVVTGSKIQDYALNML